MHNGRNTDSRKKQNETADKGWGRVPLRSDNDSRRIKSRKKNTKVKSFQLDAIRGRSTAGKVGDRTGFLPKAGKKRCRMPRYIDTMRKK
jgi:hypothetical protein